MHELYRNRGVGGVKVEIAKNGRCYIYYIQTHFLKILMRLFIGGGFDTFCTLGIYPPPPIWGKRAKKAIFGVLAILYIFYINFIKIMKNIVIFTKNNEKIWKNMKKYEILRIFVNFCLFIMIFLDLFCRIFYFYKIKYFTNWQYFL